MKGILSGLRIHIPTLGSGTALISKVQQCHRPEIGIPKRI